jgi:hypothetical protein
MFACVCVFVCGWAATAAFQEDLDGIKRVLQLTADLELERVKVDGKDFIAVRRVDPVGAHARTTLAAARFA